MKATLSFKTPDILDQLDEEQRQDPKLVEFLAQYLRYNEHITVEFDTDNMSATVKRIK